MKLKDILPEYKFSKADASLEINDCKINAMEVQNGDAFILLKEDENAVSKIELALKNGAKIVLCEKGYDLDRCVKVKNVRRAFSLSQKHLHHDASNKLKIIGVTGTNGKTTMTNLIYEILKASKKKVGLIGTLGYKIDGDFISTGFTTPDPDLLHQIFEKMANCGCEYAVIEASAHALELEKFAGVKFEIGVLTNITQDHLDFFQTMARYEKAKFKIFKISKKCLVCADRLNMQKVSSFCKVPLFCYGRSSGNDYYSTNEKFSISGSSFVCHFSQNKGEVRSNLIGEYNIENTLAAIGVCHLLGISFDEIKRALENVKSIEGRFNVITKNGKSVVIDFAHTPDGLEKVIKTARSLTQGRIITIFGCGGNRDKSKRAVMGKISSTLSDVTILTSDNPRFENPLDIIMQIKEGITNNSELLLNTDRKKAIFMALDIAKKGDIVIIAGKGGEKYQDIKGVKEPYDDFKVVYDYFRSKLKIVGEDK